MSEHKGRRGRHAAPQTNDAAPGSQPLDYPGVLHTQILQTFEVTVGELLLTANYLVGRFEKASQEVPVLLSNAIDSLSSISELHEAKMASDEDQVLILGYMEMSLRAVAHMLGIDYAGTIIEARLAAL